MKQQLCLVLFSCLGGLFVMKNNGEFISENPLNKNNALTVQETLLLLEFFSLNLSEPRKSKKSCEANFK